MIRKLFSSPIVIFFASAVFCALVFLFQKPRRLVMRSPSA